jgi:putative peptidoglycan lipid II flippase
VSLTNSAKQSAYVFLGSLISRLLGFVRVILLGTTLGFTRVSDSYSIANNAPNMMYELILGSVIASTMVPLFVQQFKKKDTQADHALTTFAIVVALGLTAVTLIASPLIARLMTALNDSDSATAQNELVLFFLLFFLPQIFFYAITAVMQAYLSARNRFIAAAFAPIINNVLVIGVLLYLSSHSEDFMGPLDTITSQSSTLILAITTTLGVVLIAAVVGIAYLRAGGRFQFGSLRHPNVGLLITRSKWMVAYACANQVALFFVIAMANSFEGGVLMYTTAFLFSQLPHGLLAVTIMTTMIPRIAHTVETNPDSYQDAVVTPATVKLSRSCASAINLVMSSVSALQIAVAVPGLVLLIAYGQIEAEQAEQTGRVLIGFLAFLPIYSLYLYIVRLGNVFNKTKQLFYINVVQNIVNIILAIALHDRFGVVGLSVAFSLSYVIVISLSLRLMKDVLGTGLLERGFTSIVYVVCALSAAIGYVVSISFSSSLTGAIMGLLCAALVQVIGLFFARGSINELMSMVRKTPDISAA